jgi:hypothetical protein
MLLPRPRLASARYGLLRSNASAPATETPVNPAKKTRNENYSVRVPGAPQPSTVPPVVHEVLRSIGSLLDAPSREFFELRFGHDFSRVRVHVSPRAAQSADAVGALAYTVGSDVVFAAGQFAPHSPSGRHLLAHELTHVVQQSAAPASTPISMSVSSDDLFEREADHIADRITDGIPGSAGAPAHSTAGPRIWSGGK